MTPAEPWQRAARQRLVRAIANAVKPDQRVTADAWAEAHRDLPPDTPYPGRVSLARTPYLYDIHRTMSPGTPWREGWWMKPLQVGGSLTGEDLIGTWICEAAGSMLVIFPTLDDAKQWELTRFEPMRAHTAPLRKRIRPAEEKGSDNTKLRKKYPGGVMRLMGANRPIKSSPIKYLKFEEPDEYPILPQGTVAAWRTSATRPRPTATARPPSPAAARSTATCCAATSASGTCTAPTARTRSRWCGSS